MQTPEGTHGQTVLNHPTRQGSRQAKRIMIYYQGERKRWRECKERTPSLWRAWMHHNKDRQQNPQRWVQINSTRVWIWTGNICSCTKTSWLTNTQCSASAINRTDRLFCSKTWRHKGGRATKLTDCRVWLVCWGLCTACCTHLCLIPHCFMWYDSLSDVSVSQ